MITSLITPLKPSSVDFSKLLINNIQYNQNKKYCNIYYGDYTNQLYIQTPKLYHIVDICKEKNYNKLTIPIYNNLDKGSKDNQIYDFINCLINLDKFVIDSGIKNENWFDKSIEKKSHRSIIKKLNDNCKVSNENIYSNGLLVLKILDDIQICNENDNNDNILISDVPLNVYLSLILNINAVWINNNVIGLYIKTVAIKIHNITKFIFLQDVKQTEYDTISETEEDNNISVHEESNYSSNSHIIINNNTESSNKHYENDNMESNNDSVKLNDNNSNSDNNTDNNLINIIEALYNQSVKSKSNTKSNKSSRKKRLINKKNDELSSLSSNSS